MDGAEPRVIALSPQGDETAPASAQKSLTFSVYVPWTSCAEGRKRLRNPSERQMEQSSPPAGSTPLLSTLSAQSPLCVPAGERFHNKWLCVSLGSGGEGAGVSTNSQAFETLGPLSLHVCVTFNQTPLDPCGFILPTG